MRRKDNTLVLRVHRIRRRVKKPDNITKKDQLDNIVNLRVIFNMEETFKRSKAAKLYVNAS